MNNLEQKNYELEEMLDGYQEQLGNLYAKIDRIDRKAEEIDDKLSDLRNLVYLPFHKKGKPISLSKKTTVIEIIISLLTILNVFLVGFGVCDIVFLIAHIVKLGAINWLSTIIIPIITSLIFADVCIIKKLKKKYIFYSKKAYLNVKLFGDTEYYTNRIDDKKAILERKRLDLKEEKKISEEQIEIVIGKINELESLLEAITDYKSKFDQEINQMYESNMPQELKEKMEKLFVKVKK